MNKKCQLAVDYLLNGCDLQAAAVSVCQYLASEVHKPLMESVFPATSAAASGEDSKPSSRKRPPASTKKTAANLAPHVQATPSPAATEKRATEKARAMALSPPTPVVAQLMEMGFARSFIEYAIKQTSSSSPERLINWLVDHHGMEVPELEPLPPLPPTPVAAAVAEVKEQRSTSSCSYMSEGAALSEESSSDDSSDDFSRDDPEEEEPEGSQPDSP